MTVDSHGFKEGGASGLVRQVDQTFRQGFRLEVGEATHQVAVSAHRQTVQTDNATAGNVASSQFTEALPINGCSFVNLIKINAGVTTMPGGTQGSVCTEARSTGPQTPRRAFFLLQCG